MDTQSIEELVDLTGKVAVVTGGATGIGQMVAFQFAAAGAAVVIADSNLEAAEHAVAEIKERGGYAQAIAADACSAQDARRVVWITEERVGSLDILVNASATFSFSPALPRIEELWSRVLSVHVKGVYYYGDAAAQSMKASGGGRILNIASMDAMRPAARPVSDDVTESSVAIVSKALSIKYGPFGINVNALAPGLIRTPAAQMQMASLSKSAGRFVDLSESNSQDRPVLHPPGGTNEILTAVLYLVSDAAQDVTGNLVVVE